MNDRELIARRAYASLWIVAAWIPFYAVADLLGLSVCGALALSFLALVADAVRDWAIREEKR